MEEEIKDQIERFRQSAQQMIEAFKGIGFSASNAASTVQLIVSEVTWPHQEGLL